jgi:hypothetical protein
VRVFGDTRTWARCRCSSGSVWVRELLPNCYQTGHSLARNSAKALVRGAPGRVRTSDPPLRRCRHRVRTSSPVSSEIPRPGVSPRFGHLGPGQTAHRTAHIIGPKAALATPSAVTSGPRLMERVRLSCGGDLGMAGEGVVERLRNRDIAWTRPHNSRDISRIVSMSVRSSPKSD